VDKPGPVHVLVRPGRMRPVESEAVGKFTKVAKLVVKGTVNYGDSVLLIGKVGNVP
jgi:hypothetical protein